MRIIFLILLSFSLRAQSSFTLIVLDKQNKHYLDSLHTIFEPHMDSLHVDYEPVMLRDSIHWVLPTNIITDPAYAPIMSVIMRQGYGDSINVEKVDTSRFMLPPKLH